MTTVCVVYAVYILVFTVTPIFMVVLIGVSNCVALAGSTRHRHPVQVKLFELFDLNATSARGV